MNFIKQSVILLLYCHFLNGIMAIVNTPQAANRGIDHLRSFYNTLNSGQYVYDDEHINTVRHVPSYKVTASNRTFIVFNLGRLVGNNAENEEKIRKAEFFINKRQLKQEQTFLLNFFYINANMAQIELANLSTKTPTFSYELHTMPTKQGGGGDNNRNEQSWDFINFHDSLNSHYENNKQQDTLLVVDVVQQRKIFSPAKRQQRIYTILMKYLNPYLMVFSEASEMARDGFFEKRALLQVKNVNLNEMTNLKSFESKAPKRKNNKKKKPVGVNRMIKVETRAKRQDYDDVSMLLSSNYSEWSTFSSSLKTESTENCKTKPISIDFEDLGFSEWLMEPKRYQSNYCTGLCPFPINESLGYSNYAILQSILDKVEINGKNVPTQLCCSPSHTQQMTILYRDTNDRDHLVKLLPNMIVNSCSCR